MRALWVVSRHDPNRSPLDVLVADGPLQLYRGHPGDSETWKISGRRVPSGIQVDFDFDCEPPGPVSRALFQGIGRIYAAVHRLDFDPPQRFLLTPATAEDLVLLKTPPDKRPPEHYYALTPTLDWMESVSAPRDWTDARREFARLQSHDGWRPLAE